MKGVHRAARRPAKLPRIALTMGDPLGIGPEVIVKALSRPAVRRGAEFVILGSKRVFEKIPGFARLESAKVVAFADVAPHDGGISPLTAGRLSIRALEAAVELIKNGGANALVTAPISKDHVVRAGFGFHDHTEYLSDAFGARRHAMMLFHSRLRVVLTTVHVPLKKIFADITVSNVIEKLELTEDALKTRFGIKRPRVAVCGVNPHAGENGVLGDEEKRVIAPAIRKFLAKSSQIDVSGPEPADTVFYRALQGRFDAVLCHYHDQGLIALKSTGFEDGVNLTLGLPFVRTSPDHGTAFDIAGKGIADPSSMIRAVKAAKGEFS